MNDKNLEYAIDSANECANHLILEAGYTDIDISDILQDIEKLKLKIEKLKNE